MAERICTRIFSAFIFPERGKSRTMKCGVAVTIVWTRYNHLHFEEKKFSVLVSIDSYHYFAGHNGFFQKKILPFIKDDGVVIIGVPDLKDEYEGHVEELLSHWLGDDT